MAKDVTRTITIRGKWIREFNRRYNLLNKDIREEIKRLDDEQRVGILLNQDFEFKMSPTAIAEFMVWLQGRIDLRIYDNKATPGTLRDDFWQNNILSTYKLRKQFDILFAKMTQENSDATNRLSGHSAQSGRKLTPAEQVNARKAARYGGESSRESSNLGAVVAVQ